MQNQTDSTPIKWLSPKSAAKYSGWSQPTIHRLIREKLVRSFLVKLPGNQQGRRMIDRESLDALIEGSVEA